MRSNGVDELLLTDFVPTSQLATVETQVVQPRFTAVDAHNHLGSESGAGWLDRPVAELIDVMDASGIEVVVDLDGGWGEEVLNRNLDAFKAKSPERFVHFGGVDWSAWGEYGDGFGEWAATRLAAQAARGAQGIKIWKQLGLGVVDDVGRRVAVDDPRLDPIWSTAGLLGLPIVIHVADPVAFFEPLDGRNERWDELRAHPDWHYPSPPYPAFKDIVEGLAAVVLRHPGTTFIGAHVGCYAEDLSWVSHLLDRVTNFYVDIAARIAELGRQPYASRRFFVEHSDRILFGTDASPDVDEYRLHYRFLETADEYFDYTTDGAGEQGRWKIYGLHLPDDVLEAVYHGNARSLLGISPRRLA